MNVLVVGRRAFVAQGLAARLRDAGHDVREISAADDPFTACEAAFSPTALVDFGFLRTGGVPANVARLERLARFAAVRGVRHVLHVSSMGVYPVDARRIAIETPPADDPSRRGPYASVKVAQEKFYREAPHAFALTIVRPGVVIAEAGGRFVCRTGGIWKKAFGRFGLLLGAAESTVPVVRRDVLHRHLAAFLATPPPPGETAAHLVATLRTKAWFARQVLGVRFVALPRRPTEALARLLLSRARAEQVRGLFRTYELAPDVPAEEGVPA